MFFSGIWIRLYLSLCQPLHEGSTQIFALFSCMFLSFFCSRIPLDQFIPWWSLLVITVVTLGNAESLHLVKDALGLQVGRFDGGPLLWSILPLVPLWQRFPYVKQETTTSWWFQIVAMIPALICFCFWMKLWSTRHLLWVPVLVLVSRKLSYGVGLHATLSSFTDGALSSFSYQMHSNNDVSLLQLFGGAQL